MNQKPEYIHYCRDDVGNIICYQEKDSKILWAEAGGFDGGVIEINFCPFCGYKIENMATKPIDDNGVTPHLTVI